MATLQRGKVFRKQTPEVSDIRVLTRADLAVLTVPRAGSNLQSLRDNHHRIARAMASGMSNIDIAATCGISYNRVSILRSDPAMAELVAHYRALLTSEWQREADPVVDFMRSNALKAQAMLSDKLDKAAEAEEFLPTRDLLGIAELGLDRTGYGKVNKNVNVNVDFAAHLEAARQRSANARGPRQIEVPSPPQSEAASRSVPPLPSSRAQPPAFRRM